MSLKLLRSSIDKPFAAPNATTVSTLVKSKQLVKQQFILEKAAQLFAKYGFKATTMDQLAIETRMNKGTLYYYFRSKSDLLFKICYRTLNEIVQKTSDAQNISDSEQALRYIVQTSIMFKRNNRDEIIVLQQEAPHHQENLTSDQLKKIEEKERKYLSIIYSTLQRGIEKGDLRPFDVKTIGRMIAVLCNTSDSKTAIKRSRGDIEGAIVGLVLHGISARR